MREKHLYPAISIQSHNRQKLKALSGRLFETSQSRNSFQPKNWPLIAWRRPRSRMLLRLPNKSLMWKPALWRLPRRCAQSLLLPTQTQCQSLLHNYYHGHRNRRIFSARRAIDEIKPASASVWYSQQDATPHNQKPTMGKKKATTAKKGRKAKAAVAKAGLRNPPPRNKSATPATPAADNVHTSPVSQDRSYQDPTNSHPSQPGWPVANMYMGNNQSPFAQLPQGSQMFPGFQQPFNMIIPQPNIFSGLQQDLPTQQQVPRLPTGFNLSNQPNFNNFFFPGSTLPQFSMPAPNLEQSMNTATIANNQTPTHQREEERRPPIQPPSIESGGIPEPTPAYLVRASFLPRRRAHPGPLLVIIDLNGTVLHRPNKRQSSKFLARRHAFEFVQYCVRTFWVVIWSSARPENVQRMVNTLLPRDDLKQVVAIWGRDKFKLTPADYNARTQCYKRLTTLWNEPVVRASYPTHQQGGGCWNQGNTVLIDDSAEKARSEPHNAITLPEFTGDTNEATDVLPKVHDYLNELCYQEDVSAYMRANPFTMA